MQEISHRKRFYTQIAPLWTVSHLGGPEIVHVLDSLRLLIERIREIVGTSSFFVDSNLTRTILCTSRGESVPFFVIETDGALPRLFCPQPALLKVSEVMFGVNRGGNFTFRISPDITRVPVVADFKPIRALAPVPVRTAVPAASPDSDGEVEPENYEDFDTADTSDGSTDASHGASDTSDEEFLPDVSVARPQRNRQVCPPRVIE